MPRFHDTFWPQFLALGAIVLLVTFGGAGVLNMVWEG
jgi:hypothetical protein